MSTLGWIVLAGLLMSAMALVGGLVLLLPQAALRRLTLPLVAFSAGSLMGGALFHMIPAAFTGPTDPMPVLIWVAVGFALFLALEQFLHWHHCHGGGAPCRDTVGTLVLIGDGLHNFLGGLAVAGAFLVDIRVGVVTWVAAAAHEVPQELGDFGVLVHAGWSPARALAFNFGSALTFPLAGLLAYFLSFEADVGFLLPLAAGNFLYIAASDLVPQVNRHPGLRRAALHFAAFLAGLLLLGLLTLAA